MSDSALVLDIRLGFPGFSLVIDETAPAGGVTALFGPSGSGKTTLLRAIAGFETPDAGRILFGGETWFDRAQGVNLAPRRRGAGFMFQDARLFPHLDVEGNLRYAEARSSAGGDRRFSFDDIVRRFALAPLLARRTGALSGGEAQRVALARTLLTRPSLLLLDEPLAALDRARRSEILPWLDELADGFGLPILYVSHDLDEVVRLATRMMVLKDGRVAAFGPTADVVNAASPDDFAGAGASAVLDGVVVRHDPRLHLTEVRLADAMFSLPINPRLAPGDAVRLRIAARDIAIALNPPEGISVRNILAGEVSAIDADPASPYALIDVRTACGVVRARITRAAVEALGLAPGDKVCALIKSAAFEGPLSA